MLVGLEIIKTFPTILLPPLSYLTSGLRELSGLAMVVPEERLDIPYPAMESGSWV